MNVLNRNLFKDCKRAKSFFFEQCFFFELSLRLSVAQLFSRIEVQMLLRCCLIHISIIIVRHILYLLYFCPCLDQGYLFMSYLYHRFFIFIFIFIMIDRIITWMQTHLLFCLFSRICPVIFGWRMWIIFQLAKVQGVA